MAPGHIIPMTNMAVFFSDHHAVRSTIVTTPSNAALVRNLLPTSTSGVDLLLLRFPSGGEESLPSVTSHEDSMRFFASLDSLRRPFETLLAGRHRPDCIVSDMYLPWTGEVAGELGIPRIVFHTMGLFSLCVLNHLHGAGFAGDGDSGEVVVGAGLPHRIVMKRSQLHSSVFSPDEFSDFMSRMMVSEERSYGMVVNTFRELEPEYADHFKSRLGKKAWHIGPLTPPPAAAADVGGRRWWLSWLNSQKAESVVYVCFGNLSRFTESQLAEIELGLERSDHPYMWVVGDRKNISRGRNGIVLQGWVPQVEILNHVAVGGFVTHCGWNSVLEAVVAGVPMTTWPLFAEQFYNEKLVVEILRVGVGVGAEEWGMREEEKRVIKREEVTRAVRCMMDGGDEGRERRRRVAELKEMAREAVADGGSSVAEVGLLLEELTALRTNS